MSSNLPASRTARALVARIGVNEDERGFALLSAIVFMVVMAGLSVVLLSAVLGQIIPANIAQKNTLTISSAEAGLQASVGLFRTAAAPPDATGKIYGDPTKLPCSFTGNANGQADGITYTVAISYFLTNPIGQTSAWKADPTNLLGCWTTGTPLGVTNGVRVTTQPNFALVSSRGDAPAIPGVGTTSASSRSLSAVYQFQVSSLNIPGGRIYDRNKAFCLQAASATAGSLVTFQPIAACTTTSANDASQLWIYDTDWKIKLASSTVAPAIPLCITGPAKDGQATQSALLQACKDAADPARWNQLWSWTGAYSWVGQKKTIADGPSGYCLATGFADGSALGGKPLLVATSCNGTFAPSSAVGAGAAGYVTNQMVNYKEFGRCADVTNENITYPFMISYPCKQDPTGTGTYLLWNHKWHYTEAAAGYAGGSPGPIYVTLPSGVNMCLQTPATGSGSSYPTFQACDATNANQNWKRYNDTGDYTTSYLFTDTSGRCLSVSDESAPADLYNGYSKIIVAVCNTHYDQKWNAPSVTTNASVSGYREVAP